VLIIRHKATICVGKNREIKYLQNKEVKINEDGVTQQTTKILHTKFGKFKEGRQKMA